MFKHDGYNGALLCLFGSATSLLANHLDGKKVFMLKTSFTDFSGGGESPIIYPRLCRTFQVILLSATMPADVLEVTKKFMRNPVRILVKKEQLTLEGIKQFYIGVEKEVSRDYD